MVAGEQRLGAPDTREVEEQAQVAGQAESTRMGQAVTIEEAEVGSVGEPREGGHEQRPLANGQIAWHVRERWPPHGRRRLDDAAPRQRHEHDRRARPPAIAAVGDVGPRDEPHGAGPTGEPDAVPKPRLEPARFSDALRPARTETRSVGHYSRLDGLPPPAAPRPDST